MIIEFGEQLHTYGMNVLAALIIFGFGVMWGSVSEEPKNEHKKSN